MIAAEGRVVGMPILRACNVTKRFKGITALDDVNIEIDSGRIYGFVGNNGAGKTTFMRIVCGLIMPDEGTLELFGSTGSGLAEAREKVGALIENPIGYPEMSARQNLRALSLLCRNSSFRQVDELIEMVGLGKAAKKAIKDYSTGMRQRYGLAAAMLGAPKLLVLDEPLSGIDVEGMDEITDLLKRVVAQREVTVLLSSHQLARLEQIATDYIFIDDGKVIKKADADTVKAEAAERGGMEDYFRRLTGGARHLLTACVYALSVCGAAIWLKSPLTKDFLAELMKTLPFCFAATALVLLLAVVLHSMMAFITMAVLFVFALWNGLGANVEWFYSVFPPYLQMNDSRTVLNYVVCIAWVLGTLPIFLIIAYHREMK